ncbi:unnamed protein product [Ectocarpus sp. 12 AP-2014]
MWASVRRMFGATMVSMLTAGTGLHMQSVTADGNVIGVRHGVVVQQDRGCPHAISPDEADIRRSTRGWPGGVLTLSSIERIGRSGNHYMAISTLFSIAFCCQVKVLELPDMDWRLPTKSGERFKSSTNLFSFSQRDTNRAPLQYINGSLPADFEGLQGRLDVCPHERLIDGTHANHIRGLHPHLQKCVRNVKMRGCEAAYLKESLGGEDSCPSPQRQLAEHEDESAQLVAGTTSPLERREAGSLVVHVRSGDIFKPGTIYHQYGQPPLLYYLAIIANKPWNKMSFVTSGEDDLLNPAYRVIEGINSQGLLGTNVEMHKDRPLWEDLQAMLCADSLALSHSTFTNLLLAHSRAKRFFLPWGCEPQVGNTKLNHFVNATMICLQRPEVEVYGIEWWTTSEAYTVYESWDPSSNLVEMVVSDSVKGMRRCC